MIQSSIDEKATKIAQMRVEKDEFFKSSPHSPLSLGQGQRFSGLNYFPYNSALDLRVEVTPFPDRRDVQLQTNTGESLWYLRYGEFRFALEGETTRLTVFQSTNGFFLPFVDAGAEVATYPTGRYLEPDQLGDGIFHIDFNQAYNPYCAYGDGWSCPITPPENRLNHKIEAGEKLPTKP